MTINCESCVFSRGCWGGASPPRWGGRSTAPSTGRWGAASTPRSSRCSSGCWGACSTGRSSAHCTQRWGRRSSPASTPRSSGVSTPRWGGRSGGAWGVAISSPAMWGKLGTLPYFGSSQAVFLGRPTRRAWRIRLVSVSRCVMNDSLPSGRPRFVLRRSRAIVSSSTPSLSHADQSSIPVSSRHCSDSSGLTRCSTWLAALLQLYDSAFSTSPALTGLHSTYRTAARQ